MSKIFDPEEYKQALEDDKKHIVEGIKGRTQLGIGLYKENIYQKRELFKHISTIAIGLLALAPLIKDLKIILGYFYTAIILDFIIIIFLLIRLREDLDNDGNSLQKQFTTDEKNHLEELLDLYVRFELSPLTEENAINYSTQRAALIGESKPKAKLKIGMMDYFTEFIVYLFVLTIIFFLFSIYLVTKLNILNLFLVIFIAFIFTFFGSTYKILWPLNKILNKFIKR
jgi:hypothetical protein